MATVGSPATIIRPRVRTGRSGSSDGGPAEKRFLGLLRSGALVRVRLLAAEDVETAEREGWRVAGHEDERRARAARGGIGSRDGAVR